MKAYRARAAKAAKAEKAAQPLKAAKAAKAAKGKGAKGAQVPIDLGEITPLTELKAPESMGNAGSQVFFAVTANGVDVHQAGVKKYQNDGFKASSTLGGGCHVHMILKHDGKNYVVAYNNSCCLRFSAGGRCHVQNCSYFHETAGTVMSGLPLSSPPPTAMPKNWLHDEQLHTMVNQVQPGAASLVFTEMQGDTIARMKQEGVSASTAPQEAALQRAMNKREVELTSAKAHKDLEEINVDEMTLEELAALQAKRPLQVTNRRVNRKRNRRGYGQHDAEQDAATVVEEQKSGVLVAAENPAATITEVPLNHPLHGPTPENYVPPTRANSDDESDAATAYTSRTQRSTSSKSKPPFSHFVARYASYDEGKKAAKLREDTSRIGGEVGVFAIQLQKAAEKLTMHAEERVAFQQACLIPLGSDNARDYDRLQAAAEKLQKEEKDWNSFLASSKVVSAGNRLQLINIIDPAWSYESAQYGEWFERYAVLDPKLQACRTSAIFGVFYRLRHGEGAGAAQAAVPIVLPGLELA